MKRTILLALALILVCSLTLVIGANDDPTVSITTDSVGAHYEAGDTITVTVTLNNGISEDDGVTGFQHVLSYDSTYLEYVEKSVTTGPEYKVLGGYKVSTSHSSRKSQVKCNWINSDTEPTEMPAAVMFTVQFVALEDVTADLVVSTLSVTCDFFDEGSVTIYAPDTELELAICPGHKWDAGEITQAPTCTAEGVKTYRCVICNQKKTEAVPMTDHTWNDGVYTKPTCTADGYTTYTCVCGETKVETHTGTKTGHTPGKTVEENYTISSTGCYYEEVVYCSVCGGEVSRTKVPFGILGDVNFDGEVDIKDANLICSYYNEILELTEAALTVADVNGDGEVDIKDANLICSFYNEIIDKFPVEE